MPGADIVERTSATTENVTKRTKYIVDIVKTSARPSTAAAATRLELCLELLVLLNDDISFLELCQLVLDLVLWEWETTNHIEERGHHFSCQIQLRQAKVFKGSVGCHSILYLGKIVTFQVWV